jgi:hypothetical protein
VPAIVTARLHELVHARLPHNYFVYFFITVFVGSALAYNLAGPGAPRDSRPRQARSTWRTSVLSISRAAVREPLAKRSRTAW